jgi:magnesium-protoporphyrin O-methyltransferase
MADCCNGDGCPGYDRQFDERHARRKLAELRRDGPRGTTRQLIDGLAAGRVDGATVLDIGAGVGAVHLALLERGAASAVDVDASRAYVAAARAEAERRGLFERTTYHVGDFTAIAPDLEPADLVALDRVVCCYADVTTLVAEAARLTRRRLGLVYPVDGWWTRLALAAENALQWLRRDPFRAYVHPTVLVDRLVRDAGLEPVHTGRGLLWQLAVYERVGS